MGMVFLALGSAKELLWSEKIEHCIYFPEFHSDLYLLSTIEEWFLVEGSQGGLWALL